MATGGNGCSAELMLLEVADFVRCYGLIVVHVDWKHLMRMFDDYDDGVGDGDGGGSGGGCGVDSSDHNDDDNYDDGLGL